MTNDFSIALHSFLSIFSLPGNKTVDFNAKINRCVHLNCLCVLVSEDSQR